MLYVDSKASKVKNLNAETRLLVGLGRLVGTAVENARLFEEQRYRTLLLAHLVHDFRTPLSVILANAELLARFGTDDDAVEMAHDVAASAKRMTSMVDNTLELSRMESDAPAAEPVHLDLSEALPRHLRGLDMVAQPLDLSFALDLEDGQPPAHTVPDRLWLILDNLLFNALKHARPESVIRVTVKQRSDAGPPAALSRPIEGVDILARLSPLVAIPGNTFLEITVHNDGKPIPEKVQQRIFEAYVRGDEREQGHRSTGLGLSIVDRCARHLGGAVWMKSGPETGTQFAFTLPTSARIGEPPALHTVPADASIHDTIPMPVIRPQDLPRR